MKTIKTRLLGFIVALSLSSALVAPNARAGLALMLFSGPVYYPHGYSATNPVFVAGVVTMIVGGLAGSPVLFVLENNGALPGFEKGLARQFPFLADQPDVLHDLAAKVVAAIGAIDRTQVVFDQRLAITIPEAEVRLILAQTNLDEAHVNAVVEAFR